MKALLSSLMIVLAVAFTGCNAESGDAAPEGGEAAPEEAAPAEEGSGGEA